MTTYYLLHRHDFGVGDAPAGASILYAVSCNLSDRLLLDTYDLLARTGGNASADEDDESDASNPATTARPRGSAAPFGSSSGTSGSIRHGLRPDG